MSKNSNNTNVSNAELLKRIADLEAMNLDLTAKLEEKKSAKAGIHQTASETVRKAREVTGIKKLNLSPEQVKAIIGFNPDTLRNEGVGRELGRFSVKNEKCGDDRASQDRYWIAKAIDTSGFYEVPEFGIVYASIYINKAGMRKLFSVDRMAKAELVKVLNAMPKENRIVK